MSVCTEYILGENIGKLRLLLPLSGIFHFYPSMLLDTLKKKVLMVHRSRFAGFTAQTQSEVPYGFSTFLTLSTNILVGRLATIVSTK